MSYAAKFKTLDVGVDIELFGSDHWETTKRGLWQVSVRHTRKGVDLRVDEVDGNLEEALRKAYESITGIASKGFRSGITSLRPSVDAKAIEDQS